MTTPDAVVARLTSVDVPRDEVDTLSCELLAQLGAGADLSRVRPLLASSVPHARRAGAFVLSELGAASRPVLGDAVGLLADDSRLVRYYALDALHGAAAALDAPLVAAALPNLDDEEGPLREKVMSLLVHVPDDVLTAVPEALTDEPLREDVAWLLTADPAAISAGLAADGAPSIGPRRRALAAVAAVRRASSWDGAWAALAESGDDALVAYGVEQKRIAGRTRRREVALAG